MEPSGTADPDTKYRIYKINTNTDAIAHQIYAARESFTGLLFAGDPVFLPLPDELDFI